MTEPTDLAVPSPRPRRPLSLTLAASACWFAGGHLAFVPGVIAYLMVPACLEDGWRNVLLSGPGLLVVLMAALSSASTACTLAAGWAYFRARARRGSWLVLAACLTGALAALPLLWV